MKKLISVILASIMLTTASVTVLADGTTTLTTTVPAATYTLNIPADQEIAFGIAESSIGNVTVTDAAGFAKGKDVQVTVTYDAFSSDSVNTTIPYTIEAENGNGVEYIVHSGDHLFFEGKSDGTVYENPSKDLLNKLENFRIIIKSEDWGKALAGEYSSTITFTSEVVSSEN